MCVYTQVHTHTYVRTSLCTVQSYIGPTSSCIIIIIIINCSKHNTGMYTCVYTCVYVCTYVLKYIHANTIEYIHACIHAGVALFLIFATV